MPLSSENFTRRGVVSFLDDFRSLVVGPIPSFKQNCKKTTFNSLPMSNPTSDSTFTWSSFSVLVWLTKKHLHQACWQLLVGNEQKLFLNLLLLSLPCCQPSSFSSLSLLRQSQQDFIAGPPRSSFVSKQLFYSCVRSDRQCLFLSEHGQHLVEFGFEMLQVWLLLVHLYLPSGIFCLILRFSGTHQLTQFWGLSRTGEIINNNHLRFYLTTCFKIPTASEHDEEALPYL